tara:strand:- start:250 stop:1152 length:903 start_codon:yes stop_codon:yes gene_type:complete
MATSGSVDFNLNMADITEEAFERCGLEFRTGYDAATSRRSLNILFAEWANRGLNLWTIEEITQTLAQLSSSSAVATYPIGTITMTVGSSTSLSVGETITGGTSETTASIITKPSSTTLTITVPSGSFTASETITGSSSSATTTVSADPSLTDAKATVDVLEVVVRRSSADVGISRINRGDYLNLPTKTTQGRASQFYVDRLITPTITVWPVPENSTDQLIYYRVKRIQDADAGTNDADIPFRFLPCLTAGLAYYLAVKKAPDRIGMLKDLYEEEFQRAASEDGERTALRLVPSYSSLSIT